MITYKKVLETSLYEVLLDGRKVGQITNLGEGWQYVPRGRTKKDGGEVFATLAECKQSLEAA